MEMKEGLFKVYTDKTKSAMIDLGQGEQWIPVEENAQQYARKLDKNTQVKFGFENDKIAYVKQVGQAEKKSSSQNPQPANKSNSDEMSKMSELKNKTMAKSSALDNATKLVMNSNEGKTFTIDQAKQQIETLREEFYNWIYGN